MMREKSHPPQGSSNVPYSLIALFSCEINLFEVLKSDNSMYYGTTNIAYFFKKIKNPMKKCQIIELYSLRPQMFVAMVGFTKTVPFQKPVGTDIRLIAINWYKLAKFTSKPIFELKRHETD